MEMQQYLNKSVFLIWGEFEINGVSIRNSVSDSR